MRDGERGAEPMRSRAAVWIVLTVVFCSPALAFEVVRDVNSPTPPPEKVVLFEKGKGIGHLTFDRNGACDAALTDDGDLRIHMTGTGLCQLTVGWQLGDGRPAGFSLLDYGALRIVCRLEGSARVTGRGRRAQVTERGVPDSGGIQLGLIDAAGMRFWGGQLSTFAPDEKNPKTMTSVMAYFNLFVTPEGGNAGDVRGIQFRMPPRGREDRDYSLVIERISLVE